jgi:hypothetical protein
MRNLLNERIPARRGVALSLRTDTSIDLRIIRLMALRFLAKM